MARRTSEWLGAIALVAQASCGGEFSTLGTGGTAGWVGGSTTGGTNGAGGSSNGGSSNGGTRPGGAGGVSMGGNAGGGGALTSISESEFRPAFTGTFCGVLVSCCTSSGFGFDQAACQSAHGLAMPLDQPGPGRGIAAGSKPK